MWTLELVNSEIVKLGAKIINCKIEIKQLHTLLHSDEKIECIVEGELIKIHDRLITGWGIALLTNRRIMFYRKSFIGTVTQEETAIDKISSASYRKGLLQSTLHVYTSNNESIIKCVDRANCEKMSLRLQQLIHSTSGGNAASTVPTNEDMVDKLERLFLLKEKGAISDEEFKSAKQKLLSA